MDEETLRAPATGDLPARSPFVVTNRALDGGPARLGLGLAALGRPGYITTGHGTDLPDTDRAAMREHAHHILNLAYGAGITYVDAARSYGAAEEFLGSWLETRQPTDITVASKWGYTYVADWQVDAEEHEVKDHGVETLRRQRTETLAALGRLPDLYQIHSVTPDSPVLDDQAVLTELAELREQGVSLGLSTSGPSQPTIIDRAIEVEVGGVPLFDAVQTTWNLLERSTGPALRRAREAGLLVVVKEALANGRLTPAGDHATDVAPRDPSPDAAALSAAMRDGVADVVLLGVLTEDHLRSNLHARNAAPATRPEAMDPEVYWHQRGERSWT
ncbi:aldo/keto reductase [Euzebya tangerina]|uniref:aldo/keto reductase n=1 Tax=Euzebya tangerina TaxID=591198 RepID=UPI000E323E18|nr:aldo/keto reductase [Euzebya tangerina]